MDISNLSVIELKAMAYDCLANLDLLQKNLQTINAEIAKKLSAPPVEEKVNE